MEGAFLASLGDRKQCKIQHCFCSHTIPRFFLCETISLFTTAEIVVVAAILICGAILIICIPNLKIAEIQVGKKTNYCLNISFVFPILSILIDISVVMNLKNAKIWVCLKMCDLDRKFLLKVL